MVLPIYIPTNSVEGFTFLHTLSSTYRLWTFLMMAILTGVNTTQFFDERAHGSLQPPLGEEAAAAFRPDWLLPLPQAGGRTVWTEQLGTWIPEVRALSLVLACKIQPPGNRGAQAKCLCRGWGTFILLFPEPVVRVRPMNVTASAGCSLGTQSARQCSLCPHVSWHLDT